MNRVNARLSAVLATLAAAAVVGMPARAQTDRPTNAVLDLDYGTITRWWGGTWNVGKGVADLYL
jgi:hypothetical protein